MRSKYVTISIITLFYLLTFQQSLMMTLSVENLQVDKNITESSQKAIPRENFAFYDDLSSDEEFSQLSNYSLWVRLLESTSQVIGVLTVNYTNQDPLDLYSIPFHLFPSRMEFINRSGNLEIINVTSTLGDGDELNFTVDSDNQLMWIALPTPISINQTAYFRISFLTTLPDGGIDRASDSGLDGDQSRIIKFAAAYPMPCVYDSKDGWNLDPYLTVGDPFYSDMGWYTLAVQTPKNFTVAATGKLVDTETNGSEIIHYFDPQLPVRELTFSASRYFVSESVQYTSINISTYYLSKDSEYWETRALDAAKAAIELYSTSIGIYPYPTFNVVEEYTHYGGMEHACQVYITQSVKNSYNPVLTLSLIIAHETAHQWFYHLVGNDQIDEGFLDEGLACWLEDFFMKSIYPDSNYLMFSTEVNSIRTNHLTSSVSEKINQSIYDSGDVYWYLAYTKTPVILEKLREHVGNESFINSLKLYFNHFKFKIAWLKDLKWAFETTTNRNLDNFFNMWFNNPYLPSYSIQSAIYDPQTQLLNFTVVDLNEAINDYVYSQSISLALFSKDELPQHTFPIFINGTSAFSVKIPEETTYVGFDLTSLGLAETDTESDFIILTGLQIEGWSNGAKKDLVSGFQPWLLVPFSLFSLILVISRKKHKLE